VQKTKTKTKTKPNTRKEFLILGHILYSLAEIPLSNFLEGSWAFRRKQPCVDTMHLGC
jgi:hypothetical protein